MATQPETGLATIGQRGGLIERMAAKYGIEPGKMMGILRGTVMKKGSNGREATNEEVASLMIVAEQYNLNPWTKEIYAFPDPNRGGIVPIIPIDGWTRIINSQERLDGIEFDTIDDEAGKPVSCTCTIHVKDRAKPVRITEYYKECYRNTSPWNQMPHRMLRHKALIQCARYAFSLSGIYDEDEGRDIVMTVQPVAGRDVDGAQRLLDRISPPEQPVPPQAPVASEPEAPAQPVHDPRLPELRAAISARAATLGTNSDEVAEAAVGLGIGNLSELDTVMNVEAMEDVLKWLDEKIAEQQVNSGSLIPNNDPLPQVEPSQVRPGVTRRKP